MSRWNSLLALAWCVACGASADPVAEIEASQANPLDGEEALLIERLNEQRADSGAPPLSTCAPLNAAAAAHSDDMLANAFLSNDGSDASTPRSRACEAGYSPACEGQASVGQLVGKANPSADVALESWASDGETELLLGPSMLVAGVGRALFEADVRWTVVLATVDHADCGG